MQDFVVPHDVEDHFVEFVELGEQCGSRRQHRLGDLPERHVSGYELTDVNRPGFAGGSNS